MKILFILLVSHVAAFVAGYLVCLKNPPQSLKDRLASKLG